MTINNSLAIGIMGMRAQDKAMANISNNIANVGTTGYKRSETRFADLVAGESGKSDAGNLSLRIRDGELYVTDNGNVIIDCAFGAIPDAQKLASVISTIPGVVDHGLFIGMAGTAILAGPDGLEIIEG